MKALRLLLLCAAAFCSSAAPDAAQAQAGFPNKAIKVIVPFPALSIRRTGIGRMFWAFGLPPDSAWAILSIKPEEGARAAIGCGMTG